MRILSQVSFGNGKFVQFTCGVKPLLRDGSYAEMLTAAWVVSKWRKLSEKVQNPGEGRDERRARRVSHGRNVNSHD